MVIPEYVLISNKRYSVVATVSFCSICLSVEIIFLATIKLFGQWVRSRSRWRTPADFVIDDFSFVSHPWNAWDLRPALSLCRFQLLLIHQHLIQKARHGRLHRRRHTSAIWAYPCTSSVMSVSSSYSSTVLGVIHDSKVRPTGDTEHERLRPRFLSAQIAKFQSRASPLPLWRSTTYQEPYTSSNQTTAGTMTFQTMKIGKDISGLQT